MVDEFQGLPNVHIVRVGTPVKPQHSSSPPLCTSPQRDERPSVITPFIKLEPEGHELDNPGVQQLKENHPTSPESSQKVTDQKLPREHTPAAALDDRRDSSAYAHDIII